MSHILVENIPALQRFAPGIKKHNDHAWSKEMAKKSVVVSDVGCDVGCDTLTQMFEMFHYTSQVPLGVILKSENKTDEMCEIMERVPHLKA